jgi:hypothetical protein
MRLGAQKPLWSRGQFFIGHNRARKGGTATVGTTLR